MAIVFNIQKFSIQDGPGIRTTVFFKGCPLRCLWCSNPESQNSFPEVVHRNSLCTGCGRCVEACELEAVRLVEGGVAIERKKCTNCGSCVEVCAPKALHVYGTEMSVDEVLREVMKDKAFYENSGGGVTASGGEPLSQAEFVAELFERCKGAGVHTCLETCGFADFRDWAKVLPFTGLVLHDLKLMDAAAHRKATGKSNEQMLANLELVAAAGVPLVIRIPIIPGINDSEESVRALARHVAGLTGVSEVNLMPYHRFGESKYENLDRRYRLSELTTPDDEQLDVLIRIFEESGVGAKVVR